MFAFICFGVDLFISQVDNETLAACESRDVKMWMCHLAAQPGGDVPVGGGIVLPVFGSRPVSISVSGCSPLLSVSLWIYL